MGDVDLNSRLGKQQETHLNVDTDSNNANVIQLMWSLVLV